MSDDAKFPLHLTDFSDRLSPMLVKELRQGMRTNLFTIAFILLQAFMVLCVLIGASTPGDSSAVSGFFWFFVTVALIIVMPIRGFGALTSEIQLNTMDLIHLTELGAWRITFGKWAALVAQTLLLVCGILPYLVMRYFFGGIDVLSDLLILFWLLLLSMVLTAVTVGFSAFKSVLLRATVLIGVAIGLIISAEVADRFVSLLFDPLGSGLSKSSVVLSVAGGVFAAIYAVWFLLDLGASRIAPEADNHATRKRLVSLAFGIIVLLLPLFGVDVNACLSIVGIIWMLVCLDAMTERPVLLPSILLPFSQRWYLRPWPMLLAPGWHTGIFYFLLCVAIYAGAMSLNGGFTMLSNGEIQAFVSGAGIIVFPLLIIHLFFSRITTPSSVFGIYLLIQCCTAVLAFFLMVMSDETPVGETAYLLVPIPMTAFFAAAMGDDSVVLTICAAATGAVSLLVAFLRGLPLYRDAIRIIRALRAALG